MGDIAPKPILLTRAEVRELLATGQADIRRRQPGPVALRTRHELGGLLWVREPFATRADGATVRVRYCADPREAEARVVAIDQAEPRFRTAGYRTWPAKYMPAWASRLMLKVTDAGEVLRVRVV